MFALIEPALVALSQVEGGKLSKISKMVGITVEEAKRAQIVAKIPKITDSLIWKMQKEAVYCWLLISRKLLGKDVGRIVARILLKDDPSSWQDSASFLERKRLGISRQMVSDFDILNCATPENFARVLYKHTRVTFCRMRVRAELGGVMKSNYHAPFSNPHLSPTLSRLIREFNQLGSFVMTCCWRTRDSERFKRAVVFFVKVARRLLDLKDISSAMAIFGGLNESSVYRARLKCEFDEATTESLNYCSEVLSTKSGFREMRRKHQEGGCIPYIGLFLTDLIFILEGQSPLEVDGVLNFGAIDKWGEVLNKLCRFQDELMEALKKEGEEQEEEEGDALFELMTFESKPMATEAAWIRSIELFPRTARKKLPKEPLD
jgi:hypothetical protein